MGRGDLLRTGTVQPRFRQGGQGRGRLLEEAPAQETSLAKDLRARLLQQLRPSFDYSPLLDARASALDLAFVRLTDEQFARLDLISEAPRVVCSGGAGTGKTFLATEVARREVLAGRSVLFTCRSPILAAFVEAQLAGTAVVVLAADRIPEGRVFDVVVVIDEAQDLMNFDMLEHLERAPSAGVERRPMGHVHGPEQSGPPLRRLRAGCPAVRAVLRASAGRLAYQLSKHA